MVSIKEEIGENIYNHLEEEANKEVALAMKFQLIDKYSQERYYKRRQLITVLLEEFKYFQGKNLLYTPLDIINVLFEAKLLFAVNTEHEYDQRRGGGRILTDSPFLFLWNERSSSIEEVIEKHLDGVLGSIRERTLVTEIRDFYPNEHCNSFFANLSQKISLPFCSFFDDEGLIGEHKKWEPGLREYTQEDAKRFFNSPSLGYTTIGTESYVYFYASAQLRSFLNLVRVAGFLNYGQIDFGMWHIEIMAPTSPVFLKTGSMGVLYWKEDEKKPWEKIPDGCLYRSFGYRGISNMFLDDRTFKGIENTFLENTIIFEKLKNPWSEVCIYDISTSLDILSSATQMPDLGAKILQIYCCLEHLFVPKAEREGNTKYIVGGINALNSSLIPWFKKLYKLRCDYAHKGFVQRDDKTLALIFESVENTLALLTAKLKQ